MNKAGQTENQSFPSFELHMESNSKHILVAGLGNPILGDDGVGWHVAEEVSKLLDTNFESIDVKVECYSHGGLGLMEQMIGFDRVILIDAFCSGTFPVGTIRSFLLNDLPDPSFGHSTSVHDTSLRTALNVGRSLDIPLPDDGAVSIIGIETSSSFCFSNELSETVKSAVPGAVKAVMDLLIPYTRRTNP